MSDDDFWDGPVCKCGCGVRVGHRRKGPPPSYASSACRQRAYRERVLERKKVFAPRKTLNVKPAPLGRSENA